MILFVYPFKKKVLYQELFVFPLKRETKNTPKTRVYIKGIVANSKTDQTELNRSIKNRT